MSSSLWGQLSDGALPCCPGDRGGRAGGKRRKDGKLFSPCPQKSFLPPIMLEDREYQIRRKPLENKQPVFQYHTLFGGSGSKESWCPDILYFWLSLFVLVQRDVAPSLYLFWESGNICYLNPQENKACYCNTLPSGKLNEFVIFRRYL